MGLAIVKAIIEAHGGRIEVSSQLGNGSVFSFWSASRFNCWNRSTGVLRGGWCSNLPFQATALDFVVFFRVSLGTQH